MRSSGKLIGMILIGAGLALLAVVVLWVGAGVAGGKYEDLAAPVLGIGAALIFGTVPLVALGTFLYVKGRQEAVGMAEVQKERTLLNMVQTRGQVDVPTAVLELKVSRDTMKQYVYDLVGKGLFTGYVNWDKGVLYSRQAADMPSDRCPNCGGKLELAGKGVVQCPYCGTEIFLK
ncbi:MAG: TFIIB-type zinc ribbon-containing protein [Anaerolineae bacterium]